MLQHQQRRTSGQCSKTLVTSLVASPSAPSVSSPFNFPIILSIRAVAPALALGNSVILKPDPRTAICVENVVLAHLRRAGLPAGVFGMLPGGADAGEAIVVHPSVRVIAFTGSTRAGRAWVNWRAAISNSTPRARGKQRTDRHGRRQPDRICRGAFGSFMHQGQIC